MKYGTLNGLVALKLLPERRLSLPPLLLSRSANREVVSASFLISKRRILPRSYHAPRLVFSSSRLEFLDVEQMIGRMPRCLVRTCRLIEVGNSRKPNFLERNGKSTCRARISATRSLTMNEKSTTSRLKVVLPAHMHATNTTAKHTFPSHRVPINGIIGSTLSSIASPKRTEANHVLATNQYGHHIILRIASR